MIAFVGGLIVVVIMAFMKVKECVVSVFVEVSFGEALDKYSILKIKSVKISDQLKLEEIKKEMVSLEKVINFGDYHSFLDRLQKVNESLWDINDSRKRMIENSSFDEDFISLSVSESKLNDERFLIKQEINTFFGSSFHEQKSYDWA